MVFERVTQRNTSGRLLDDLDAKQQGYARPSRSLSPTRSFKSPALMRRFNLRLRTTYDHSGWGDHSPQASPSSATILLNVPYVRLLEIDRRHGDVKKLTESRMCSLTGLLTTRPCRELMSKSTPKRIAIVGGGFSGVMTAVNLARLSTRPLQVTVINCRRPDGRGVAHGRDVRNICSTLPRGICLPFGMSRIIS